MLSEQFVETCDSLLRKQLAHILSVSHNITGSGVRDDIVVGTLQSVP